MRADLEGTEGGGRVSAWIDITDQLISSDFADVIDTKTDLCAIMSSEGSDKGAGWHNYTLVYDKLFNHLKNADFSLFELGMGTTNPTIKSNMGADGRPGASLRGWSNYFTRAKIFGADVDPEIVGGPRDSDRITTHWVDQTNPEAIRALWQAFPYEFEIIIDDGLHEAHANITFLENSYAKLSPTGVYIIEDIVPGDVPELHTYLQRFSAVHQFEYRMFEIPNPVVISGMVPIDNRLAVLARK